MRALADELGGVLGDIGAAVSYPNGQAVGAAIRRHFRKLGIDNRPHDLRHTFATTLAATVDMGTVARMMRHASIQTTQRYVRWNPPGADVVTGLYAA